MAEETSKKRPAKPFRGKEDGKPFTKENQPAPELKKAGWQRVRAERHFTQAILKEMGLIDGDGKPFKEYIRQIAKLAKEGHTEAMKQVRTAVEDDIQKIDITTDGKALQMITLPNGAKIPIG